VRSGASEGPDSAQWFRLRMWSLKYGTFITVPAFLREFD
jgi:hypothetical protein